MIKLRRIWWNFIWQPVLAVLLITAILFLMNHFDNSYVLWAVGAGSLSSTIYIIFGRPDSVTAEPLNIIGGYIFGIGSGLIFRVLVMHFYGIEHGLVGTSNFYILGTLGACSVGLSLFLMSIFKVEHPPAAGMALVLVIDLQDYNVIILVIVAAIILALIKRLLSCYLVNL